jgi:type IV fimbrial biogenesis protein FimT
MQAKNCFRRIRGFTLVELMVTLSIAAVLLAVGVPPFSRLIANNRMATQTNELVGALNLARAEAVRRGQPVSIRASADAINFGAGWQVFSGTATAGDAPDDAAVIRNAPALAGKTTVKRVSAAASGGVSTYTDATSAMTDRRYVVFNGRGGNDGGSSAFFRVCDAADTALRGRVVRVSTVGRISLETTDAQCP